MIDIPLSLRVPPQGRYTAVFIPVMNVISNRRTIRSTLHAGPCRDLCRYDGRLGMSPVRSEMDRFTIGPKIPVKLTITPPSSSLTALAIPIGV